MKNEVRFKDKDLLNSFLIKSIKSSLVTLGYKNSNKSSFELINKFQSKNNFQKNLILKENSEIENRAYTEVKTNEKKSLDYFQYLLDLQKVNFMKITLYLKQKTELL